MRTRGARDLGSKTRLTAAQRTAILAKTACTCHVCGGRAGKSWQADYVKPHRLGGQGSAENGLPICRECNTARRSYSPKVQQLIMRLGIYARSEIRHGSPVGEELLRIYLQRQRNNRARRTPDA